MLHMQVLVKAWCSAMQVSYNFVSCVQKLHLACAFLSDLWGSSLHYSTALFQLLIKHLTFADILVTDERKQWPKSGLFFRPQNNFIVLTISTHLKSI